MFKRVSDWAKKLFQKRKKVPEQLSVAAFLLVVVILGRACDFRCFRVNTSSVECVIDDFAHSGDVGVDIHAIASGEMSNNSFGGDFSRRTCQLGKAPSLDVINSL